MHKKFYFSKEKLFNKYFVRMLITKDLLYLWTIKDMYNILRQDYIYFYIVVSISTSNFKKQNFKKFEFKVAVFFCIKINEVLKKF